MNKNEELLESLGFRWDKDRQYFTYDDGAVAITMELVKLTEHDVFKSVVKSLLKSHKKNETA